MVLDAVKRECNMAGDGDCWAGQYDDWRPHNDMNNHLFADGHVKAMKQDVSRAYRNYLTKSGGA